MTNTEDILRAIAEIPLEGEDMARMLSAIAKMVGAHRRNNKGFVPLSIFPHCISIGGVYPCVEILPRDGSHFALKKRSAAAGEQGWDGKYTIPGVAVRTTDNQKAIFERLSKEMFGNNRLVRDINLNPIGSNIYYEEDAGQCSTPCMSSILNSSVNGSCLTSTAPIPALLIITGKP